LEKVDLLRADARAQRGDDGRVGHAASRAPAAASCAGAAASGLSRSRL
jgi:hypothetical protein